MYVFLFPFLASFRSILFCLDFLFYVISIGVVLLALYDRFSSLSVFARWLAGSQVHYT